MDPNATLDKILKLAARVMSDADDPAYIDERGNPTVDARAAWAAWAAWATRAARDARATRAARDATELAELTLALNQWITKGGFLPKLWER